MAKTLNGRISHLGSMYFEKKENEEWTTRKYCVGYCPNCKIKIGLTPEELREFADNTSMGLRGFLVRLTHSKILIP